MQRRTMNLQMMPSIRLAAGHSGQNKTASRSEMRLSKIARYSASFEFFVVFVLPDLLEISIHAQKKLYARLFVPLRQEDDDSLRCLGG